MLQFISKRYQSRYLCLTYNNNIDGEELQYLLVSKGLDKIAVYTSITSIPQTVVFLVFDKPRDFFFNGTNDVLTKPTYLMFESTPTLTKTVGKKEFFEYHQTVVKTMFENKTHEPFYEGVGNNFLDIKRKDSYYFYNLKKEAVEKMTPAELNELSSDFDFFLKTVEKQLETANRLSPLLAKEAHKKKELLSPSNLSEKEHKKDLNSSSTNLLQVSKNKYISVEEDMLYLKQKEIKDDFLNEILLKDLYSKENLVKLYSIGRDALRLKVQSLISENNINISSIKNPTLKIVSMDLNLKAMLKTSDSNRWFLERQDQLTDYLKDRFSKFIK